MPAPGSVSVPRQHSEIVAERPPHSRPRVILWDDGEQNDQIEEVEPQGAVQDMSVLMLPLRAGARRTPVSMVDPR